MLAACLAVEGSVASHETALALHLGEHPRTKQVHVLVPRGKGGRSGQFELMGYQVELHRTRALPPGERCSIDGIPATTPARALLDLAQARSEGLDEALAELLASKRLKPATLSRALREARQRCRPGRARLEQAFQQATALGTGRTESPAERRFPRLALEAGLPPPEVQYEIRDPGGALIGRADFAWPKARLVVEIDGFRWHSSVEAQTRDQERDRQMARIGWAVIRFAPADLVEGPEEVVEFVCAGLEVSPKVGAVTLGPCVVPTKGVVNGETVEERAPALDRAGTGGRAADGAGARSSSKRER
ncbi:MAG: DUF559 domain-containing protein [Acidimicrobiales bacterium]